MRAPHKSKQRQNGTKLEDPTSLTTWPLVFAEFLPWASLFLLNGTGTINVLQVTNNPE